MRGRLFITSIFCCLGGTALATGGSPCWRLEARLDENGNPLTACDMVTAQEPSVSCGDLGNTQDEPLKDAKNGFPFGKSGWVASSATCQNKWLGDTDGDGLCDGEVFTSAQASSAALNTTPCPALGDPE